MSNHVLIENHKGFGIYLDRSDGSYLVWSDAHVVRKKRKSLQTAREFVDDHLHKLENLDLRIGTNMTGSEIAVKVLACIGRPATRQEITRFARRCAVNNAIRPTVKAKVNDILKLRASGTQKYVFDVRVMSFESDTQYFGLYKWEEKDFDVSKFEPLVWK